MAGAHFLNQYQRTTRRFQALPRPVLVCLVTRSHDQKNNEREGREEEWRGGGVRKAGDVAVLIDSPDQ
jgi:hypothetical protein